MKAKKEIEFNGDDLLSSVEGFRDHVTGKKKITLRMTTLPKPVKPIKPSEIKAIRNRLNVSQAVFAALLNVPPVTEKKWENGERSPSGAALKLLYIAKNQPEVLVES